MNHMMGHMGGFNPFYAQQPSMHASPQYNPFMEKEAMMQQGMNSEKEKQYQVQNQPKTPWMDQKVFGMSRGGLVHGGLGLLMGGRMF